MVAEATIWLIVCVAGIACGVIAGVQQRVTALAVIAIALVALVATTLVAWLLPRQTGHAE